MSIPSLLGSYIDETYQRLVQVSGSEFADGLGNPITFGTIDTGSFATTGSNTFIGNQTITGSIDATGSFYSLKAGNVVLGINSNLAGPDTFAINNVGGDSYLSVDTHNDIVGLGILNTNISLSGSTIRLGHDDSTNVFIDASTDNIIITGSIYFTGTIDGGTF